MFGVMLLVLRALPVLRAVPLLVVVLLLLLLVAPLLAKALPVLLLVVVLLVLGALLVTALPLLLLDDEQQVDADLPPEDDDLPPDELRLHDELSPFTSWLGTVISKKLCLSGSWARLVTHGQFANLHIMGTIVMAPMANLGTMNRKPLPFFRLLFESGFNVNRSMSG